MKLPSKAIVRIVRSDNSGSSEGFAKYLSLVSNAFETQVGASPLPKWPNQESLIAVQGNDGIVNALGATSGAIAYVSFDRVLKAGLTAVRLQSGDWNSYVAATEDAFRQAVKSSKMQSDGLEAASLLNMVHSAAWPITVTTYVIFDANPKKAADVAEALQFLYWTQLAGDRLVKNTGFAPLPVRVQATFSLKFSKVMTMDGSLIKLL